MVRVLVAGAAGALGKQLALELRRRGHEVYGLIRNEAKGKELKIGEVKVVIGSITDKKVIEELAPKVDVIVNASSDFTNINLEKDSLLALSAALEKLGGEKKKVIFLSGGLDYKESKLPLNETSPTNVDFPLVAARLAVHDNIINSKVFYGTVLRLPFFYGGESGHWTIYFEQAAKTGKVSVYGDGSNILAYGHIADLADGVAAVVEADAKLVGGEIFNIAEFNKDIKLTQKDIAVAFALGAGRDDHDVVVEFVPWDPNFAFFNTNVWLDTSKITRVLTWKARHSLLNDVKDLYNSWKEYNKPGTWF